MRGGQHQAEGGISTAPDEEFVGGQLVEQLGHLHEEGGGGREGL